MERGLSAIMEIEPAERLPMGWPAPPRPEAFRGLLGEMVESLAPNTEADRVALLAQSLVLFGNQAGRRVHFCADGAYHALNLFVAIVGASSASRKGTSFSRVREVFSAADPSILDRITGGLSSGEGLIWHVRDGGAGSQDAEGVADKRLIVFEGEFARVLKVMARDGSTLSAVLREAWDTGKMATLTKNDSATATNAHVSIIGQITGEELRRYLTAVDSVNGFGNRFAWFAVNRARLLPDGSDWPELQSWSGRLRRAQALASNIGEIKRTVEAGELWRSAYPQLTGARPGLMGSLTSRAEAQVMRFAGIYAVAEGLTQIGREHLEAALALWDFSERSCAFIFGEDVGHPVADKILRELKRAGKQGLTRTEITSEVYCGNLKPGILPDALNRLRAGNLAFAAEERDPNGGRPAERWFHHSVR